MKLEFIMMLTYMTNSREWNSIIIIQSLLTEEEAEYKEEVNRMLTAANCMMKRPQPSMEEAHI